MKRVLFVDDNEVVINTYRKVFTRKPEEWQCFFAVDVMDAIDILAYAEIDIIITDLEMPLYNGAQLLNYVHERYPGITRIVFSGSTNLSQNMKTVNNAHRFIAKPHTIADLEKTIEDIYHLYRTVIDAKTRRIINGIQNLPALPSVYLDLIEEFTKDEYSLHTIAELISSDVGLTVEILKMVNSAYFGLQETVTSPYQAVTLLGGEIIKGLILTAHISRSFTEDEQIFSFETWENHSLLCGIFCRAIAQYENMTPNQQELAFVCGIVHDVGRIILATSFPEKYKNAIEIAEATQRPLGEVEKEVLGTTHGAVGAYLLGLWGLPDIIVESVASHHTPNRCTSQASEYTTILHMADVFTYEIVPEFILGGIEQADKSFFDDPTASDLWQQWRAHCVKQAVREGYLKKSAEDNTATSSELELTSLEEGNSESDFLHGYDDMV